MRPQRSCPGVAFVDDRVVFCAKGAGVSASRRGKSGQNKLNRFPYDASPKRWLVLAIFRRCRDVCNNLLVIMMMMNVCRSLVDVAVVAECSLVFDAELYVCEARR